MFFGEPRNMDKLSPTLGIQIDYGKGCIRVIEKSVVSPDNLWEVKKEIFSMKELNKDTELDELIISDRDINMSVSRFCVEMDWI